MKYFFDSLLNFLIAVANIFLTPINTIISNNFPNVSSLISTFTNAVNNYLGNGISYFFSILPPNTRTLVLLYITFLIAFYTISFLVHAVIKIIEIIKAVKIW